MISKSDLIFRVVSVIFWIGATIGFISDEFLPFLASVNSVFIILSGLIIAIMGLCVLTNRNDRWLILSFFVLSLISTVIVNKESVFVWFNGTRDFFAMLFCLPIFRFLLTSHDGAYYKKSFDNQLYIFLCIQLVCVFWQFFKYGAGDHGGGSLGNERSGTISLLIYIISFYLLSQNWKEKLSYVENLKQNKRYVFLLLPTFFNETKVSFILLLFYFILLYRLEWKSIVNSLKYLPLMLVLFWGLVMLYSNVTNQSIERLTGSEFYEMYLFGEDREELMDLAIRNIDGEFEAESVWVLDMPRFAKLAFVPEVLKERRGGMSLGAGLGHFKGGTFADHTAFAVEYEWLIRGSVPTSFYIVLQLGILGLCWFAWYIWSVLSFSKTGSSYLTFNLKLYLLLVTVVLLFYLDCFRIMMFAIPFVYLGVVSCYQKPKEIYGREQQ